MPLRDGTKSCSLHDEPIDDNIVKISTEFTLYIFFMLYLLADSDQFLELSVDVYYICY